MPITLHFRSAAASGHWAVASHGRRKQRVQSESHVNDTAAPVDGPWKDGDVYIVESFLKSRQVEDSTATELPLSSVKL